MGLRPDPESAWYFLHCAFHLRAYIREASALNIRAEAAYTLVYIEVYILY